MGMTSRRSSGRSGRTLSLRCSSKWVTRSSPKLVALGARQFRKGAWQHDQLIGVDPLPRQCLQGVFRHVTGVVGHTLRIDPKQWLTNIARLLIVDMVVKALLQARNGRH